MLLHFTVNRRVAACSCSRREPESSCTRRIRCCKPDDPITRPETDSHHREIWVPQSRPPLLQPADCGSRSCSTVGQCRASVRHKLATCTHSKSAVCSSTIVPRYHPESSVSCQRDQRKAVFTRVGIRHAHETAVEPVFMQLRAVRPPVFTVAQFHYCVVSCKSKNEWIAVLVSFEMRLTLFVVCENSQSKCNQSQAHGLSRAMISKQNPSPVLLCEKSLPVDVP